MLGLLHGNGLTARSDEITLGNDMDREWFGCSDIRTFIDSQLLSI